MRSFTYHSSDSRKIKLVIVIIISLTIFLFSILFLLKFNGFFDDPRLEGRDLIHDSQFKKADEIINRLKNENK